MTDLYYFETSVYNMSISTGPYGPGFSLKRASDAIQLRAVTNEYK
jgi:hypothetical protein